MRVLGIDTSLRSTGFGVVESKGSRLLAVEYGNLRMQQSLKHSACLEGVSRGIKEVIERTAPVAVAIEGAFFFKNVKTAMVLGEARGAVIAACAGKALPIYEYAPRRVKQAIVGFGGAAKEQVRQMVMTLLNLDEAPQEDASDALAIAVCHLHSRRGIPGMEAEEV